MGGIKNKLSKLSKLSNKVKNLFNKATNLPPLLGEADENRRLIGGVNKQSKLVGLTIPLSDYRLTSPFSQRGTKLSLPLAKEEKCPAAFRVGVPLASQRYDDWPMSVAHRWGRITKYTSLACLTLAILSALVLNIISSYSNSSTRSNAEPVSNSSTSTLANNNDSTCDPSNTNAVSCISMSISSYPSATGDTDDGNLSLSIPQGGGLVAGRHTVSVDTNNASGGDLELYTLDSTALTSDTQQQTIPSIGGATNYYDSTSSLLDNTWGVAIPDSNYANQFAGYNGADVYEQYVNSPGPIKDTGAYAGVSPKFTGLLSHVNGTVDNKIADISGPDHGHNVFNVYYGVYLTSPSSFPAGDYLTSVVYVATTNPVEEPDINSVTPNTYELGSNTNLDSNNRLPVTITGTNLQSTYRVYLVSNADSTKQYDITKENITIVSNTELKIALPTDITNSELEAGEYTIHVATQGGEGSIGFTYTRPSICRNGDPDSDCQVDIDDNMIPVTYDEERQVWIALNEQQINSLTGIWYDYGAKKWANAVTVQNPNDYRESKDVDESDILGYWVYIPRYAYEVQRRDAIDRVVDPQNFDIVFQTADEKNTPKTSCNSADNIWKSQPSGYNSTNGSNAGPNSSNVLAKDYRTGCWPNNRTYIANSTNTTWATHPAFTWQYTTEANGFDKTYELNGIWAGKFETTGTRTAPTVKPNQHANIREYIGNFYLSAKSIGVNDPNNVGGGSSSTSSTGRPTLEDDLVQNSHNLSKATSHMLKNSEWGGMTYLAHSKYGAGINTSYTGKSNVSKNGAVSKESADADGDETPYSNSYSAATGCGPVGAGETGSYPVDVKLDENTIESNLACGSADKAYNGETGVKASTTNTIYGVYGLSGGADEYVMGNRTTSASSQTTSDTDYFKTPAKSPYVDLYVATPNGLFGTPASWSSDTSDEYYYNYDVCAFETCGGTATYETTTVQSVSSAGWSWGAGAKKYFVYSSSPWFVRGGDSNDGGASPFYAWSDSGFNGRGNYGSRAVLLALPDGQ